MPWPFAPVCALCQPLFAPIPTSKAASVSLKQSYDVNGDYNTSHKAIHALGADGAWYSMRREWEL